MYVDVYIYIYMYISRTASGNPPHAMPPPPQTPRWRWPAIYHHQSRSHMLLDWHAGLVPPMHYIIGNIHAAFTNVAIQSIYNVLLPIKVPLYWPRAIHTYWPHTIYTIHYLHDPIYSLLLPIKYLYGSHILATIKISCAIYTCWPRTTHTLSSGLESCHGRSPL